MIFRYLMWFMLLMLCSLYLTVKFIKVQPVRKVYAVDVQEQLSQVNREMSKYIDRQL